MCRIYKDLPDNYECFASIDMKNNKKEFALINILAIIAFIPFFIGLGLMEASYSISTIGILIFFMGYILYIVIHELIHAFFFKWKNDIKVKYKFHGFAASASVPGVYFQKTHYLIVSLAPFVVSTAIFLPFLFILSNGAFYILYFLFATHVSGCVGDFYVTYRLLRMPKDILIEDYGVGMRFFRSIEK